VTLNRPKAINSLNQGPPASLAEVRVADVDAYFAPVEDDLTF
jgi:hypothetical protein